MDYSRKKKRKLILHAAGAATGLDQNNIKFQDRPIIKVHRAFTILSRFVSLTKLLSFVIIIHHRQYFPKPKPQKWLQKSWTTWLDLSRYESNWEQASFTGPHHHRTLASSQQWGSDRVESLPESALTFLTGQYTAVLKKRWPLEKMVRRWSFFGGLLSWWRSCCPSLTLKPPSSWLRLMTSPCSSLGKPSSGTS